MNTNWELEDEYMWKGMSPAQLNSLSTSTGLGYLMPSSTINLMNEEKMLENILKEKIGAVRKQEHNMAT